MKTSEYAVKILGLKLYPFQKELLDIDMKPICPKCGSECKEREIQNKVLVYDCQNKDCGDQIALCAVEWI